MNTLVLRRFKGALNLTLPNEFVCAESPDSGLGGGVLNGRSGHSDHEAGSQKLTLEQLLADTPEDSRVKGWESLG